MAEPVIITVAITGALPRKKDNPAVPVTPTEQIESTHQAFEAGASLVHVHVRNPDESPSSDPELYGRVQEGVRKHCPGMIVQFSTGGRGRDPSARGAMLYLKPDMASLATGSVNFPDRIYENPPDFVDGLAKTMLDNGIKPEVEVFDLAMLYSAANLVKRGFPAQRNRRRAAEGDLGRRGHRPQPVGDQSMVPRHGRPLPDRARGQPARNTRPARVEQRRVGEEDRRQLPALRSAARLARGGAADPRSLAGGAGLTQEK